MEQSEGNDRAAAPDGSPCAPPAEALRAAIDDAAAAVRRFLFGMCGRWDQAEDLAQEAMLRAWQKRESFDRRCDARTWIFAIARNHWLDSLRRQRRAPRMEPMNEGLHIATSAMPGAAMERRELSAAVARAIGQLPSEMREALALRESDGLSFPQIAEVLDIPLATAKTRVRRALLRLAEMLEPLRGEVKS